MEDWERARGQPYAPRNAPAACSRPDPIFTTCSAPIVPPAPPRFSTTIDWPSWLCNCSNTIRGITSVAEPAPNGTTALIGRLGQESCAAEAVAIVSSKQPESTKGRMESLRFRSNSSKNCAAHPISGLPEIDIGPPATPPLPRADVLLPAPLRAAARGGASASGRHGRGKCR